MFDVAAKFRIFVLKNSIVTDEQILDLKGTDEFSKITQLNIEKVDVIICDSIGLCAAGHIVCSGMKLYPNNSGEIYGIIRQYLAGSLKTDIEYFRERPCGKRNRSRNRHPDRGCKNIFFKDMI